ncbi:sigma-70 family RNA polymerase sigma factor [uncultured Adlercreutzia sp.]|uniref:RNA polymerase sigma factor n=1 Tax=uncultured Adlercreutzia sp. TaxID=875803 RepID=UPI0025FF4DB7|nr:sigma-70 family RNA polymerase sigma factor [uncultured Adlercreutzia sp.]
MAAGKQSRAHLASLVRRAQAGDEAAFAEIYELTGQAQFFLLSHKVGLEAAGDLVQELYLVTWRNIQAVQPYALLGYLNGVGRNLCREYLREKARNDDTLSLDHEEAVEDWLNSEAGTDLRDPDADPADTVVDADERARLARALRESLDDTERAAVVMRYYQGMKIDEIAEALDTSRNTVKRTLSRALLTLRQNLTVLPFGWGLGSVLAPVVGDPAAPPLRGLGDGAGRETGSGRTRKPTVGTALVGAATVALVVGAVGFAVTAPREAAPVDEAPASEPTPLAEQPVAAGDTEAPQLLDVTVEGEATVLTFHDETAVAKVWCVGADGTTYAPAHSERDATDGRRSTWTFALPSGTYEAFAVDTLGNQAAGTVTCDIVPTDPAPPEHNPLAAL